MELLDHSLVSGFTLYIDLVVMDLLAPEPLLIVGNRICCLIYCLYLCVCCLYFYGLRHCHWWN